VSAESHDKGRLLRFIVSGGWAEQDAHVVRELLEQGRRLATLVVDDDHASAAARALARDYLDQLSADTF
jgi:hypothetical protein